MQIKVLADKYLLPKKEDVFRLQLYGKLLANGIKPFENDIDILIELYSFGGYRTTEEQMSFINLCIEKSLKRSEQSVRNILSKYIKVGILLKPRNREIIFSEEFLPRMDCDKVVLQTVISHKA